MNESIKKEAQRMAEFFIKQYEFDEKATGVTHFYSKKEKEKHVKKAKENQVLWKHIKSCLETEGMIDEYLIEKYPFSVLPTGRDHGHVIGRDERIAEEKIIRSFLDWVEEKNDLL